SFELSKQLAEKVKEAVQLAEKKDWEGAQTVANGAQPLVDDLQKEVEATQAAAERAYNDIPEDVKQAVRDLVDKVREMLSKGKSSHSGILDAIKQKLDSAVTAVKNARSEERRVGKGG